MENKYFTPDIEIMEEHLKYFVPEISDLCIGYELEHLSATGYIATKFEIDSSLPALQELIKLNQVRVPYLTKEQIEAEGWEDISTDEIIGLVKTDFVCIFDNKNYTISLTCLGKDKKIGFAGNCKDINTFRKIIKLLGI
jgi:hypothetical protein